MSVLFLLVLQSFDPRSLMNGVDAPAVDRAIDRGLGWLRSAPSTVHDHVGNADELILYTLLQGGASEKETRVGELMRICLDAPLERTYKVALQAMILQELDPAKHQPRIQRCAQHLVDNQCANGQWGYGEGTSAEPAANQDVASGVARFGGKPPLRKVAVKKSRDGTGPGDNSNSQYAALGLRACHDAGVQIPREVLQRAALWWRQSQHGSTKGAAVATGPGVSAEPRGWCYDQKEGHPAAYGAMTAGGVGALVIYDHLLGLSYKRDPSVASGLAWIAANFAVEKHPGDIHLQHPGADDKVFHHYWLYGLERAGMLYGTASIGGRKWYAEGARHLLATQKEDGRWEGSNWSSPTYDTCFAILFLKRATRPVVASEDALKKR